MITESLTGFTTS